MTRHPRSTRLRAIALPIMPSPTIPTVLSMRSLLAIEFDFTGNVDRALDNWGSDSKQSSKWLRPVKQFRHRSFQRTSIAKSPAGLIGGGIPEPRLVCGTEDGI